MSRKLHLTCMKLNILIITTSFVILSPKYFNYVFLKITFTVNNVSRI